MKKNKDKEKIQVSEEQKKQITFLLEESIPKGDTEQKRYLADVALFYTTIFKDKLKHFIGLQLEELSVIGRSEEMNNVIRANISCFRLIDEWMQVKTNQHLGILEEMRNKFTDEKEFINNFKIEYDKN